MYARNEGEYPENREKPKGEKPAGWDGEGGLSGSPSLPVNAEETFAHVGKHDLSELFGEIGKRG